MERSTPHRAAARGLQLLVVAAFALVMGGCRTSCVSLFAPRADLLEQPIVGELQAGRAEGAGSFDHSALDALLRAHVDPDSGRVDYAGLEGDRALLEAYLEDLAGVDLGSLGRDEQLALLINAYNAYTLMLVVEHYPGIDSIKDLDGPWSTRRYRVGGHTLSLDDIEHGLIRPIFRDPRIHFAVNCASEGCPPLATSAYTGAGLDAQLDRASRRVLQDPRYARVADGELELTSVMNWYRADFTDPRFSPHAPTLAAWVAPYATDEVRRFIERHGGDPPVGFLHYDWSLNAMPAR